MILLAAEDKDNDYIADELRCNVKTVGQWRDRFIEEGRECLKKDQPRGHPKATVLGTDVEEEIVRKTTQESPENATHWRTQTMAKRWGAVNTAYVGFGKDMDSSHICSELLNLATTPPLQKN